MNARRHGIVGPIILIGFGALLLLSNLGILQWSVWEAVFRLWPLLLVAAGLDLLIGRRSALGALLVAVIVIAMLGVGIWWISAPATGGSELPGNAVSQPLDGARAADVEVRAGAARLQVGSGASAGKLIEGTVFVESGEQVLSGGRVENDVLKYSLRTEGLRAVVTTWSGDRVWDLRITDQVPLALHLSLGAGETLVDLRGVKISELTMETGAGRSVVTLPPGVTMKARVNLAVGEVVVRVPKASALKVTVRTVLGTNRLPSGGQRLGQTEYTSAGYDSAANRLDVDVSCPVGSVIVEEY